MTALKAPVLLSQSPAQSPQLAGPFPVAPRPVGAPANVQVGLEPIPIQPFCCT